MQISVKLSSEERSGEVIALLKINNIEWYLSSEQVSSLNGENPVSLLDDHFTIDDLKNMEAQPKTASWWKWEQILQKKNVKNICLMLAAITLFGGGGYIAFLETASVKVIANAVDTWGGEVSLDKRKEFRREVNELTELCAIRIDCIGDNEGNDGTQAE